MKWNPNTLVVLICLMSAGCHTSTQNPPVPRAGTGYVDFYTDSDQALSWEVKRRAQAGGEMRTVFSNYKPVEGSILRLATPPGRYDFELWISNRFTQGPQTVTVEVLDGNITPVHVTLAPMGSASVKREAGGIRHSYKGYARTEILHDEAEVLEIQATSETPRAYQPKERMPYFASSPETERPF